jgi:hypothetical protein
LIPHLSGFAPEPIIDFPLGQLQNKLPKPELSWTQPGSAAAQKPISQITIRKSRPKPLNRFPIALVEQPANDKVTIPVDPQAAERIIPEEIFHSARETLFINVRFFRHSAASMCFQNGLRKGDRFVMKLTQNALNITNIQQLAQGITGAFYPTAGLAVLGILIAFAMMKPVKKA